MRNAKTVVSFLQRPKWFARIAKCELILSHPCYLPIRIKLCEVRNAKRETVFSICQGNPFSRNAKRERLKLEKENCAKCEMRNWTFVKWLDIFVGGKKSDLTKETGHFRCWIIGYGKISHWERYALDQKNWTFSSSPLIWAHLRSSALICAYMRSFSTF